MIAIIDYDAGNIKSVEKAVLRLGEECVITRDEKALRQADKIILPGVGAFGDAMGKLDGYGLTELIKELTLECKKPFLGICLGLQLMFEESEEAPGVKGLGLLPGKVIHFPPAEDLKIPQIGWNSLHFPKESRLFEGISEGAFVYFVHSYYLKAENIQDVAAESEYGIPFHAAVEHENLFACQFHPEKSSDVGLGILSNFLKV